MKKIIALILCVLMLLGGCGPVGDDTTLPAEETDPATDQGDMATVTDEPIETPPPVPVERVDYSIDVLEDTYVMNKNGNINYGDTNFGGEDIIHIKSLQSNLTRYGYLKFDISSLKGDNDFTCIDLDLTMLGRQSDAGSPMAVVEVYGADIKWSESTLTMNTQPEVLGLITTKKDITAEKVTNSFSITDYVRKALANGQTEIALYLREASPVALHIQFASKESGENIPKLSVYYGTKEDDAVYQGSTKSQEPEVSKGGIDNILGWHEVENRKITVLEDTYVEGGESVNKNFGKEEAIENKAIASNGKTNDQRISLFKFDISDIDRDFSGLIRLVVNVFDMQSSSTPRTINVYACNPYEWEEDTVTYNTLCEFEELVTTVSISGIGIKYIDVTDYVKMALGYGDKLISFCFEGDPSTVYRTRIDSSEKSGGVAPHLEVVVGKTNFTTKLNYAGENPWDVAAEAVSTWLQRWEIIKKNGSANVETIVKDPEEYSIIVDATTAGKTNGANTEYSQYPTRNVSTLKSFKADNGEVSLYDEYGGYMGGERYEATGYFYTKKIGDRWWNIDPLGYPFYRVGVVEVSHGSSPNQRSLTLAKFGTKEAWGSAATERLKELGFNSAGGWSEIATLANVDNPISQTRIFNTAIQYAKSIDVAISAGGTRLPKDDVIPAFDPGFKTFTDEQVKSFVTPYVGDPSVYGWMSDNELSDGINMLDHALALNYKDMRYVYTYATAWTFMYMKTGKANVSVADVTDELRQEFLAMTYDKYFEVVTAALDRYDPNHMYMGCRFVNNNYKREYVMRVAGYWCDVVTFNYYSAWEGDPTLMANIGEWLGETPFVVTEWYAKGMDVWEKNPLIVNKTGAGWTVRTQADRGKFYQNYALMLMECKDCVGFDWFKYWDNDPSDLNADASNRDSNKGMYSNEGEEYTDLSDYMVELNTQKYNLIKFFDAR